MLRFSADSLHGTSWRSSAFHPRAPTEANMRWSCSAPLSTPTTLSTPTWRMSFHDSSGRGGRNSLSLIIGLVPFVGRSNRSVFDSNRCCEAGQQAPIDTQLRPGDEAGGVAGEE